MSFTHSVSTALRQNLIASATVALLGAVAAPAIAATNVAPTISGSPASTASIGSAYVFVPTSADADGDELRFVIKNRPSWLSFSYQTGGLSGKPTTAGTWNNIVIYVKDGSYTKAMAPFSITVGSANRAPTISGAPITSAGVGTAYNFQPSAQDADGNALGFSVQNKPSWASFSTASGKLSGTPVTAGTFAGIVVSVSDGKATTALPAFGITVTGTANRAPTLSGTPTTALNVNSTYNFKPTATDADGDTLSFAIANKPSWAAFNTTTGALTGQPDAGSAGTYANVSISVSDGKVSATLPSFAINVNQVSNGAATLSWTPPTQNVDGTSLTNLAGYRVYYGTSAAALTTSVQVSSGVTSYMVENLAPATYYFSVRSYSSTGVESTNSNVATKTVQ